MVPSKGEGLSRFPLVQNFPLHHQTICSDSNSGAFNFICNEDNLANEEKQYTEEPFQIQLQKN